LVVQIGGELASSGWIAARVAWSSATTVMLDRFAQHDPHSQAAAILVGDLATTVRALTAPTPSAMLQTRAAYAATWKSLDAVASASVEAALTAYPTAEPGFVKAAVRALPQGAGLLLGNSLPIRVVDQVCSPTDDSERWVVTQRGANGIDGLLAGAAGAVAARGPAMLLLGDVSFSHDVGSLAVLRTCNVPLVVVVIDNAGGRIFDTLPIATATEVPSAAAALTPYFTTPPGLDIGAVARAFGLNTIEATTPEATHNAVRAAFAHAGATIIVAHCSSNGAHAVQTAVVTSLNAHVASETKTEKS
jgi:2-succinyl-5-enolpyruvyl-6-hydroxy-3-cyclohexene-1-carboxylate synthase